MKTLFITMALMMALNMATSKKCHPETAKIECSATEYQNYVDCVRSRMKRSADCYDDDEDDCTSNDCSNSCDSCDCNECTASDCGNSCNKRCCNSCCKFNQCSTNHCCHKVCHNSCRTSSCRSSCRRSCYKSVRRDRTDEYDRDIIVPGRNEENSDSSNSNSSNLIRNRGTHNITTVIHLNNLINNTNLIDVPINLNNSNINNITVENNQNGSSIYGSSSSSPCCNVIEPRTCVPTGTYPFIDCFHLRRQQCGQFCGAANTVHKVAQNVCYNTQTDKPTCGQQVIYVPQPQTSCSYQPQWPYVSCSNQGGSCNGCYDYLLNPFKTQRSCSGSCYSYGLNQGAVFRQGPVLNPGYSLPLPTYNPITSGGCNAYGGCGLGGAASYINPGMYYGMGGFDNYGIYGSYNPNFIQPAGFDSNILSTLGTSNLGNLQLPMEQFVPMNFTGNSPNVLYAYLSNSSDSLTPTIGNYPGNMFGQPISIDEETFKKLLGQGTLQKEGASNTLSGTETMVETEAPPTTTAGSSFFG